MNTTEQFEVVLAAARRATPLSAKELRVLEVFAARVKRMRSKLDDLRARNAEFKLSAAADAARKIGHRDAVKLAIYRP